MIYATFLCISHLLSTPICCQLNCKLNEIMRKIVFFISLLFIVSCTNEKIDWESNPIDSNIHVDFREILGIDTRQLTLFCATEKAYPCINYPIATKFSFDNNKLSVTFTDVVATEFCFTAVGPATTNIVLPVLGNGEYELELNNGNLKNSGKFIVSDEKVDILFKNPKGISITRQSTHRVPSNTYWGTIGYHTESTAQQVTDFLQKTAELGAKFNKQNPGDYFYYEIDKNGDIITETENSGYHFVKAIVFNYTGDEESFKKQLKELSKTYFDDMYISIYTYKGEHIYNWG